MPLPFPNMDFDPFQILTAAEMDQMVANDQALADGSGLNDGAVTPEKLQSGAGTSWAWQSWTPTYGAGGSMTYTNVTTEYAKYVQVGKTVIFQLAAVGTLGGTASTEITITLPVPPLNPASNGLPFAARVSNPSVAGFTFFTNKVNIRRYDGSAYSTGASKGIYVSGAYEVA